MRRGRGIGAASAGRKMLDFEGFCDIIRWKYANARKMSVASCFPTEKKGHRLEAFRVQAEM